MCTYRKHTTLLDDVETNILTQSHLEKRETRHISQVVAPPLSEQEVVVGSRQHLNSRWLGWLGWLEVAERFVKTYSTPSIATACTHLAWSNLS